MPKFYAIESVSETSFVKFFDAGLQIYNIKSEEDGSISIAQEGFKRTMFDVTGCGVDINCD